VNRNNICMTCKASYNYCPRIESLVVRKMLRHHTERQNETKKPWECGCCKRTNRGDLEKCRICGAHNITFRKAESSWWCWDKSMENAGYVRDEREGLQDGRHAVIQAELQGRVDEAQRREDERLQAIAEAEREAARKVESERRRAELEWKRNAPAREAAAAAKAEEEKRAQYQAKRRASMAILKEEAEEEMEAFKYGAFGSQNGKASKLQREKERHAKKKKHLQWIKEKLARDDRKRWEKEFGHLPASNGGFGAKMLLAGYTAEEAHVAGTNEMHRGEVTVPNNNGAGERQGRQGHQQGNNRGRIVPAGVSAGGSRSGASSPQASVFGSPVSTARSPTMDSRTLAALRTLPAGSPEVHGLPSPYAHARQDGRQRAPTASTAAVAVAAAAQQSVGAQSLPMLQRLLASTTDHIVVSPTTVGAGMLLLNNGVRSGNGGGASRRIYSPDGGHAEQRIHTGAATGSHGKRLNSGMISNGSRFDSGRVIRPGSTQIGDGRRAVPTPRATSARIDSGSTRQSRKRGQLPAVLR
jgi:hypothetical protein